MDNVIKITVQREDQPLYADRVIEVFLNDTKCAELSSGESAVFEAPVGVNKINLKRGRREASVTADFSENAVISVWINDMDGDIETELEGAPQVLPIYFRKESEKNETESSGKQVYPDDLKTSPITSALLSLVIVGLGQMINGQRLKGLLIILISMVSALLFGFYGSIPALLISMIDAYICANKLKRGETIGKFSFF